MLLHPSSRTFFGLEWNGVYFVFALSRLDGRRVLIYITISVLPLRVQTRSFGVPMSQYIDNRHVGQLYRAPASSTLPPNKVLAEAGYFIAIVKSQCVPSFVIRVTFKAISQLCCSSKPFVRVEGNLRTEVLYWRFLDHWRDCFPWRSELHVTVSLFSDASDACLGCGSVSRRTEVNVQRLLAL